MNSFEALVAMLLERDGFWVRNSVKVNLSKEEKRKIGRPSSPRWELDIVAYKGATNELRIVECKSYLDSVGVSLADFDGSRPKEKSRYKLFVDDLLFKTVTDRLVSQFEESDSCAPLAKIVLCLAAGKIKNDRDRDGLHGIFSKRKWLLMDDQWIVERVREIAKAGYEDDVAIIVAKLLERARPAA